ncbi:MAG: DUF2141 domain-containing protein [Xanthomonadales bacterium]|nr:DUF2141 domain-containing protein [Xanthomonadales bacterium]
MSTETYKKSLQAQLDIWSPRIDKGQPKVRLRFIAVRKIITGALLLNQRYSPRDRKIRIRKEIRRVAFFTVLIFLNLPASAFSQTSCLQIHVKIQNIRNSTGNLACGIFESPEGFPKKFQGSAKMVIMKKIQTTQAQCNFADIPPGTYAIAVIHDENMNGELDTNWMGIPTEGYGFSNTTIDEIGAPAFSAARFSYDGQKLNLTIKLKY